MAGQDEAQNPTLGQVISWLGRSFITSTRDYVRKEFSSGNYTAKLKPASKRKPGGLEVIASLPHLGTLSIDFEGDVASGFYARRIRYTSDGRTREYAMPKQAAPANKP